MPVETRAVNVSETYVNPPPGDIESPEAIAARLERWVAAAESNRLADSAPPAAIPEQPSPAPAPARKVGDDLLPSDPGWSAILNEDVTPIGLATVACLFTLLSFVAMGLRNASIASGAVLLTALVVGGRNHSRSALATRIIVGVAVGMAIACLS